MEGIPKRVFFFVVLAIAAVSGVVLTFLFFATKHACYAGRQSSSWRDRVLTPTMLYASIGVLSLAFFFYLPWLKRKSCAPRHALLTAVMMVVFFEAGVLALTSGFMCGIHNKSATTSNASKSNAAGGNATQGQEGGPEGLLWGFHPQYLLLPLLGLAAAIHFFCLVLGRLRGRLYTTFIAYPFSIYCSSCFLLVLITPAVAAIPSTLFNYVPWLAAVCYSLMGLYQSLRIPCSIAEYECVEVDMRALAAVSESKAANRVVNNDLPIGVYGDHRVAKLATTPTTTSGKASNSSCDTIGNGVTQPLRIAQITDPHLGSLITPEKLRRICEQIASAGSKDQSQQGTASSSSSDGIDLVFLTGDMFNIEAHREPNALHYALEPLAPLAKQNKVFACFGNHDLEDAAIEATARRTYEALGIRLLVDETCLVPTRLGLVEVIGLQFYTRHKRKAGIVDFFNARYRVPEFTTTLLVPSISSSRSEGGSSSDKNTSVTNSSSGDGVATAQVAQTFILLHDPQGFPYIPASVGGGALILSGHTHGGHVGLYCFGLRHWTMGGILGLFDNGVWLSNGNVLYVHRGQGSRSIVANAVMRMGVPPEHSVLLVHPACSKRRN